MRYSILRTDKAREQLFFIRYIAEDSGSIDTALEDLDKLEQEIGKPAVTPHMGSCPRWNLI